MGETTATLVISVTRSYCGNCRKPTMPKNTHHTDVSGWTPQPGAGCGARFVDMRSDNGAVTDWHLRQVRPDLPIHGQAEEPPDDTDEGDDDGGLTAADFFDDAVYQPETDPVNIAAAEKSLNALRGRLTRPTW